MTQPFGLPHEAQVFLREHAMRKDPCEHCGRDDGYVQEVIGRVGMDDDLPLHRYTLKTRTAHGVPHTATELVQREVWSSGPMIWLCLCLDDGSGTVLQWRDKDMADE